MAIVLQNLADPKRAGQPTPPREGLLAVSPSSGVASTGGLPGSGAIADTQTNQQMQGSSPQYDWQQILQRIQRGM